MAKLPALAIALFAVSAILAGDISDAAACMPGFAHPQKQAMIFWHDGTEILVWSARVTPGRGGSPLNPAPEPPPATQLAWILAVPSAPLAYHVVENADFEGTTTWLGEITASSPYPDRRGGGGGYGSGGRDGLNVGETVRVGEYDITPIAAEEGAEAGSAAALNTWLRRNSFPEANAQAVAAYATEGATFLAVKARLRRGQTNLDLRPIAIAFRSANIVLPVRLSASDAPFGLNATIFSTRVPDVATGLTHGLAATPLRAHGTEPTSTPGLVSIVPAAQVPAELRQLIAPVTSEVPGFERMLTGSIAVSRLAAQPLSIAVAVPDPTIGLGAEVAPGASAAVAHAGHWIQDRGFMLGAEGSADPEATPAAANQPVPGTPSATETAATAAATAAEAAATAAETEAAAAATAEDDGGLCSATGRSSAMTALGLGVAGLVLVARRRRRSR